MPELANKLNHSTMEIYSSFNQAASHLVGLMAVDYFFAKEISQSIAFTAPSTSASACFSEKLQTDQQWFHLLIALSASLREGHSCLRLVEVAGKRLFSDGKNLDQSGDVNTHKSQPKKEHVTGFLFNYNKSTRELLAKCP